MQSINYSDYFVLALLLILWCSLHSALISVSVTNYFINLLGDKYRYYRLFFNTISLVTLLLVFLYRQSVQLNPFFAWDGYLHIIQGLLVLSALFFFYMGARKYDAAQFLGITQIKHGTTHQAISRSGKLDTTGILSLVRHPWYLGLLLLIWSMPLDISMLVVNVVFTLYLFIGASLEERKLVIEFGDQYRNYQHQVSMIFPVKWLRNKISELL